MPAKPVTSESVELFVNITYAYEPSKAMYLKDNIFEHVCSLLITGQLNLGTEYLHINMIVMLQYTYWVGNRNGYRGKSRLRSIFEVDGHDGRVR